MRIFSYVAVLQASGPIVAGTEPAGPVEESSDEDAIDWFIISDDTTTAEPVHVDERTMDSTMETIMETTTETTEDKETTTTGGLSIHIPDIDLWLAVIEEDGLKAPRSLEDDRPVPEKRLRKSSFDEKYVGEFTNLSADGLLLGAAIAGVLFSLINPMVFVRLLFFLPFIFSSSEVDSPQRLRTRIPFSKYYSARPQVEDDEWEYVSKLYGFNPVAQTTPSSDEFEALDEDMHEVQPGVKYSYAFSDIWNSFDRKEKQQFTLGSLIIILAIMIAIYEASR